MPNILTGSRIFGSILLLSVSVFSPAFYIIYLFCGLTDIADGAIARKTNKAGKFGAQFDSAADFIFATVCLIKLLPAINLPPPLLIWVLIIFIIKCANIFFGILKHKPFVAEHTAANKITGFLLFLLPLTLSFIDIKYSGTLLCLTATYAAIGESRLIMAKQNS